MKITLSPVAGNYTASVFYADPILTIDGNDYDLSVIPIGGQADGEAPFIGVVTRDECTIQYFYDSQLAEHNQSTDINDYVFDTALPFVDPIKWKPIVEEVV